MADENTSYPTSNVPGNTPQAFEKKKVIFRTYQWVWYILGVIEVLLALRLALRLIGANQGSSFVDLIYTLSAPLRAPFIGIVGEPAVGVVAIEWATVIAMVVYWILAYGLVSLLQIAKPVTPTEVNQKL